MVYCFINQIESDTKLTEHFFLSLVTEHLALFYTLPFKELKTQALAKKPKPTAAKPHPATSSYRKAPNPINNNPISIIIKVAHPKMVFLFIPIIKLYYSSKCKYRYFSRLIKNFK